MGILLLNKKLANTTLLLLVPLLVVVELQHLLSVVFPAWVSVVEVLTWIVGLFLIWRPRRRTPK